MYTSTEIDDFITSIINATRDKLIQWDTAKLPMRLKNMENIDQVLILRTSISELDVYLYYLIRNIQPHYAYNMVVFNKNRILLEVNDNPKIEKLFISIVDDFF